MKEQDGRHPCQCGCGTLVKGKWARGHAARAPRKAAKRRGTPGSGSVGEYRLSGGETQFYYKYTDKNTGKQVTRRRDEATGEPFRTKTAAEKAMRAAFKEVDDGVRVTPSKRKLGDFLLLDYLPARRKIADSTRAHYEGLFRCYVIPAIGSVPLARLDTARIARLFADLEDHGGRNGRGLSPSTLRSVMTPLSAALTWAVKTAKPPLLKVNPALGVELPDEDQDLHEVTAWTWDEAGAFLSWCDERWPGHAAMWRVAFGSGMRRGELLALTWADVTPGRIMVRRQVRVGPRGVGVIAPLKSSARSGRKSRTVETGGDLAALEPLLDLDSVLAAHKRRRGSLSLDLVRPAAAVFGDLDGSPVKRPRDATRDFARAVAGYRRELEEEGKEVPARLSIHGARHTHCTLMLDAGMPVKVLAERAGNSPEVIASTYSHVISGSQAAWLSHVAASRQAPEGPGISGVSEG